MLIERISGVRPGRVCARRQHIQVFDDRYNVRSMSSSSALRVVSMDGTIFERLDRLLYKSGLVKCVGMNKALNIIFITNAG